MGLNKSPIPHTRSLAPQSREGTAAKKGAAVHLEELFVSHAGKFQSDPLPEDTIKGKGFRSNPYALIQEIFFRLLGQKSELCITQIIQGL